VRSTYTASDRYLKLASVTVRGDAKYISYDNSGVSPTAPALEHPSEDFRLWLDVIKVGITNLRTE